MPNNPRRRKNLTITKVNPVARAMLMRRQPPKIVKSKKVYSRKRFKRQDKLMDVKDALEY
jgi:hypothetical protein